MNKIPLDKFKKDFKEILAKNEWRGNPISLTPEFDSFMSDFMVSKNSNSLNLNSHFDSGNIQDIISISEQFFTKTERNGVEIDGGEPRIDKPQYSSFLTKTNLATHVYKIHNVHNELFKNSNIKKNARSFFAKYWIEQYLDFMMYTIVGLSKTDELFVGDKSKPKDLDENLMDLLFLSRHNTKGVKFRLCMNYNTLKRILETDKRRDLVSIKLVSNADGDTEASYFYKDTSKISVVDDLEDGVISLINQGCFIYEPLQLAEPFAIEKNNMADKGGGKEMIITRNAFIIHPVGFSFVGKEGTNYSNRYSLSNSDLSKKGLYEMHLDKKYIPFSFAKIKMA